MQTYDAPMSKGALVFWSALAVAAGARFALSFGRPPPDASMCVRRLVSGTGVVASDPERKESGQAFVVEAGDLFADDGSTDAPSSAAASAPARPCASGILLRAKTKLYPRFTYGDRVEISGKLSKPMDFSGDDGRTFDYIGYLAKDGVYFEMKSAVVARIESGTAGLTSILYGLKRRFVSSLERALGEPHAALAAGLVVGEKSALGAGLLDDFRTVGLIHIVVLSGFNITVVAVAMRKLLSFLPRAWGIAVGAAGIVLFGILVGGGATVIRSCFMAVVALAADLIRRDYSVGRALAFAALVMLADNPLILLHDPSFQLSFLATAGLIAFASPIEARLGFIPERFGIRSTVAATAATQLSVSPYILYMMGQISLIGVVVNILVLPFIPATMLAVFATGAAGLVWAPAAQAIGWLAHLLLGYELAMVEAFAKVPFAAAHVPAFSIWWVAGFYAVLACALLIGPFMRRRKERREASALEEKGAAQKAP